MTGNAYVYRKDDEYCVLFTHDGEAYDHADGFDDELSAVEAARRGVYGIGTVRLGERPWEQL